MKDVIDRLFALGIGIAATSKEQIEKLVDDLVEKGKVAKSESAEVIEELIRKGKETQEKWDASIKDKVQETTKEMNLVTREEFEELKRQVEELKEKLEKKDEE